LIELVLDFVTIEVEKRLKAKTFSLLGAVQLEKELKYLIEHFSEDSKKGVRSKFSKLSQLASILMVEKANYILDVWNSPEIQWKLSGQEIKSWLRKRRDLAQEEVEKLILDERKNI
jgi:hypothetical protein